MVKVHLDFQWNYCLLWNLKNIERTRSIAYILYKKDDDDIFKNIIINKLQEIFILMPEPMTFDKKQVSIKIHI